MANEKWIGRGELPNGAMNEIQGIKKELKNIVKNFNKGDCGIYHVIHDLTVLAARSGVNSGGAVVRGMTRGQIGPVLRTENITDTMGLLNNDFDDIDIQVIILGVEVHLIYDFVIGKIELPEAVTIILSAEEGGRYRYKW